MKKLLLIVSLFAIFLSAHGDRVALNFENDCLFNRTMKNQDNDYTHGTMFEYVYDDLWYFKLQQNMYTPADISAKEHIPGDRPYCGYLGAEIGREMFKDDKSPWSHYLGINFGMVGPASQAGPTQIKIHEWLGCRKPEGWDNQLADEFVVNAQWWTKYHWFIQDWIALIPRGGVLVGTMQDAAEVGCDLKIGWNIKKDVGNNMIFSASPTKGNTFWDNVSIYIFGGPDCRYYLYNHVLEGSLFNSNDDGLGVDIYPFVGEVQFGAGLEVYGFFVKYYAVIRTYEFHGQHTYPDYGGLVFGYTW